MGRRLRSLTISAIIIAGFQIASLDAWPETAGQTSDDEGPSQAEVAAEAGTAAGLVERCGVDIAPINAAFNKFLASAKPDSPSLESLSQRYKAAEAAALSALANDNSVSCAGAISIMRATVQNLMKPTS